MRFIPISFNILAVAALGGIAVGGECCCCCCCGGDGGRGGGELTLVVVVARALALTHIAIWLLQLSWSCDVHYSMRSETCYFPSR